MDTQYVKAPEDRAALALHDLRDPEKMHSNLQAADCNCRQAKNGHEPVTFATDLAVTEPTKKFSNVGNGPSCASCGNITVLQGSCWLCQTCGSTTGCG